MFRWLDRQGCLVRVDVIRNVFGNSDHCDMGSDQFLTVGDPLGEPIYDDTFSAFYWDPDGSLGQGATVTIASTDLPSDASDSGYRRGDTQLWVDDIGQLYLIDGGRVQVLARDRKGLNICA